MLTFIDESGYPRPTDSTKNPILLGVCIHENDIKPITNQIYKLKDSIYGKQDEIKSTKLIREATITKNRTNNKAKMWRDTLVKQIHPDVCSVDGAEAAVAKVNELYSRMVEDE